jgi:hypothetical protein
MADTILSLEGGSGFKAFFLSTEEISGVFFNDRLKKPTTNKQK